MAIGAAAGAASAAVGALAKQAVTAYADYEQLVGGVETLFKDSAGIVNEYAANAYKTAGLSANQYMETVTSFSASLLQSLGGDTEAAAKVADMAITDMADNANKMGTGMEAIQNAYQGFAKQNYTMLDNLKLGYGGTKSEMERLLADAGKLSGQKFDISSYADIVEAIHIVQTEMGITGTTAQEAEQTIQGSAAAMKAAWGNVLVGLADETQDIDGLVGNLADSIDIFAQNIVPRVAAVASGIVKAAPVALEAGAKLLAAVAEGILTALPQLAVAAVEMISKLGGFIFDNLPRLQETAGELLTNLTDFITAAIPELIPAAIKLITNFVSYILQQLPAIAGAAAKIIGSLAASLIKSLPQLLQSVARLGGEVVQAFVGIGKNVIAGFIDGIKAGFGKAKDTVKGIFDKLVGGAKEELDINSPSKVFAEIGDYCMQGLAVGMEDSSGKVIKTQEAISQAIVGCAKLSAEASKASYEASKEWLDKQVKYNDMSADDLVAAWQRVVNRSDLLADEQKSAGEELLKAQKSLAEEQQKAADEAAKAIEDRAKSIAGFAGIFDKVALSEDVSKAGLLDNLRGQVDTLADWQEDIAELAKRGIGGELIQELQQLGPKAAAEVAAMTEMSDDELNEYAELYAEKAQLAQKQAEAEAQGLASGFCAAVQDEEQEFTQTGEDAMSGFLDGLRDKGEEAVAYAKSVAERIIDSMRQTLDIHSPSRKMANLVGEPAGQGFMLGFEQAMRNFHTRAQAIVDGETGRISASISARAQQSTFGGITREITNNNRTVEKVAHIEGDGVTGELIRMLNLRLKEENRRVGVSLGVG